MNVQITVNESERANTNVLKSTAKRLGGVYLDALSRTMESGSPEDIIKIANRSEYTVASVSNNAEREIFGILKKIKPLKFNIIFQKMDLEDRKSVRDLIIEKDKLIDQIRKLNLKILHKHTDTTPYYDRLSDYQKRKIYNDLNKLNELKSERIGETDIGNLYVIDEMIRDYISELEYVLPGSSLLNMSQIKEMRPPSPEVSPTPSIIAKYIISDEQQIINADKAIKIINNQLEPLMVGSSKMSVDEIKHMRPGQLSIKDYNQGIDDIIPDTSSIKKLYPHVPYYDNLSVYHKDKIADLVLRNESLKYELEKVGYTKVSTSSKTDKMKENIDKLKRRLSRIMHGEGKKKPGLIEMLPSALVNVDNLRTKAGRMSISGYDDLPRGKRSLFGVRARKYIECYDEIKNAESARDKYMSADAAVVIRSTEIMSLINDNNEELEEIIPGSSNATLKVIKKMSPERFTIEKLFPSFSDIDRDTQVEYMKLIRLRNQKMLKTIGMEKEISDHEFVVSKLYKNVHNDFRYNAVEFANALYISVYPTVHIANIPKRSLWNVAYFIACSPNPVISIDHLSTSRFGLSPNRLSSLVNHLSSSPIQKDIYISSTYLPPDLSPSIQIISSTNH